MQLLHSALCVFLGLAWAGLLVGMPAVWSLRSSLFRYWLLSLVAYGSAAYFVLFQWNY